MPTKNSAKRDGLSQAEFFRAYITAYLEKDSNVMSFIQDYKLNSVAKEIH